MSAAVNDDPRLGALIVPGEVGDIVVVGFPSDEGVKRNGGRPGAAGSPSLFFHPLGSCTAHCTATGGPEAARKHLMKVGPLVNPEFGIDLRYCPVKQAEGRHRLRD
jgi:hypothetical protein